MIGRLIGRIVSVDGNAVLVDVHGVGYEVEVTTPALAALDLDDASVELYTHLVVREDSHALCGFRSAAERAVFRTLIKVNGVGPKLAITLLSALPPSELSRCVSQRDAGMLTNVPGIGKKTADRLLIELADSLDDLLGATGANVAAVAGGAAQDAVSALVQLGWRITEARRAVDAVYVEGESTEALIRAALKRMASVEAVT